MTIFRLNTKQGVFRPWTVLSTAGGNDLLYVERIPGTFDESPNVYYRVHVRNENGEALQPLSDWIHRCVCPVVRREEYEKLSRGERTSLSLCIEEALNCDSSPMPEFGASTMLELTIAETPHPYTVQVFAECENRNSPTDWWAAVDGQIAPKPLAPLFATNGYDVAYVTPEEATAIRAWAEAIAGWNDELWFNDITRD
jgi:hypothetical protein